MSEKQQVDPTTWDEIAATLAADLDREEVVLEAVGETLVSLGETLPDD